MEGAGGCWWMGAGGCFSCLGFVGFLGPDFMGGADQVTAWNVFSVTPQSQSHILPMQWGCGGRNLAVVSTSIAGKLPVEVEM